MTNALLENNNLLTEHLEELFPQSLRETAVDLITKGQYKVKEVARALGVGTDLLDDWLIDLR